MMVTTRSALSHPLTCWVFCRSHHTNLNAHLSGAINTSCPSPSPSRRQPSMHSISFTSLLTLTPKHQTQTLTKNFTNSDQTSATQHPITHFTCALLNSPHAPLALHLPTRVHLHGTNPPLPRLPVGSDLNHGFGDRHLSVQHVRRIAFRDAGGSGRG